VSREEPRGNPSTEDEEAEVILEEVERARKPRRARRLEEWLSK